MNAISRTDPNEAWTIIREEQRRDRQLRRISAVAWIVTAAIVLVYGVSVGLQVLHAMRLAAVGAAPPGLVWVTLTPLLVAVGTLSLLVAVLSTVGIFFRLRTASLAEIRLRLAALEESLADGTAGR
jgi:hypothetical protein